MTSGSRRSRLFGREHEGLGKPPAVAIDPVMLPFHTAVRSGRFAGYAGPSRRSAAEAISKYILVDMYAKAVHRMAPADAVKWPMESW